MSYLSQTTRGKPRVSDDHSLQIAAFGGNPEHIMIFGESLLGETQNRVLIMVTKTSSYQAFIHYLAHPTNHENLPTSRFNKTNRTNQLGSLIKHSFTGFIFTTQASPPAPSPCRTTYVVRVARLDI